MPWSCDPARPVMTKSLLPQSPSTPQQLAGKDGFLAESHTWPPYAVQPSSPPCPPLWPNRSHKSLPQCRRQSQVRGLPSFHGTKVRPSGRLPSERDRPLGSLVTGMPAETNVRAIRSFRFQSVVSGCSPWSFLANKAMDPSGTDQWPTLALMYVAHTGSDPAANQHPLSPPHYYYYLGYLIRVNFEHSTSYRPETGIQITDKLTDMLQA